MRNLLLIGLFLIYSGSSICQDIETKSKTSLTSSMNVLCSPELYTLTVYWANEYSKLNPKLKIDVIKTIDFSHTGSNLCFILDQNPAVAEKVETMNFVIGRDVIVPIINSKNPFLDNLNQQGISANNLAQIFNTPDNQNWGTLLNNGQVAPVHYYTITDDESIKLKIAEFLNTDKNRIEGINVKNAKEMVSAIQKDPYAIGFCKMVDVVDVSKQSIVENIKLLPIDKNGNGKLDYMENIYDDYSAFSRGIWIGKYPKALFGNIYSITSLQPKNENEIGFLKWLLTEGQQNIDKYGYSDLVNSEKQVQLAKLDEAIVITDIPGDDKAALKIFIYILAIVIIIGSITTISVRYLRRRKEATLHASSNHPIIFDEHLVKVPKGLYFDTTHTWTFMEESGHVKIGIDDFLTNITGNLTNIKMKNPGEKIKKGDILLTLIQKGKQLNIYSPVTGTIKSQNIILTEKSSLLNSSPYSDGWVYLIEPTIWLREIQFMNMAEKHFEWLKNEFSRFKDFLANAMKANTIEYVLQDGGQLKVNILEEFGPKVWEDFQTNFIDTAK